VLANPVIIGIACALYVAEFVADKVPAFDSVWDGARWLDARAGGGVTTGRESKGARRRPDRRRGDRWRQR
jgi:hypothetical protein